MSEAVIEPTFDVHLDPEWAIPALAADVREGFAKTPKSLPPKWFYDETGSIIYDEITRLPEYYPFGAEREILTTNAAAIAADSGADTLVELGSGTSEKTRLLLAALNATGQLKRYVPFDVSEEILRSSAHEIATELPGVAVHGVVGDFDHHLQHIPQEGRRLIILLGGTVGNFAPEPRARLLAEIAGSMRPGDCFLLGTDLVKDRLRIETAYDDVAGVTAAFNKNVLSVINNSLNANFNPDAFRHVAHYDDVNEWIEMMLVALSPQIVHIADLDLTVNFDYGEYLCTEISAKFRKERVFSELTEASLNPAKFYTDSSGDFGVTLAVKEGS